MISVEKAQQILLESIELRDPETLSLDRALGRFLAGSIQSPLDLPSFDNSAMDGYALRSEDTQAASPEKPLALSLAGTSSAGGPWEGTLKPGQALRILTGAVVPSSADTVVKQEDVVLKEGQILLEAPFPVDKNIRRRGEELKKGDLVFPQGTGLTPAGIGLLASLGIREVSVYSPPRVGILVTGSEIVTTPSPLKTGQIYDSNSFSLKAALQELRLPLSFLEHCTDQKGALIEKLSLGFKESDFLMVTGGISVGDYDFVREAGKELGIEEVFWKVKQKPGKPIFFGRKESGKFLFGLPGNPASALVCFYEYVRPALLKALGSNHPFLPCFHLPLSTPYENSSSRTHFLRGQLEWTSTGPQVRIGKKQGSHIMHSFSQAQCLVRIPPEKKFNEGDKVSIHLLASSQWIPPGGLS